MDSYRLTVWVYGIWLQVLIRKNVIQVVSLFFNWFFFRYWVLTHHLTSMSFIMLVEWLLNNIAEWLLIVANSILTLDYLYIEWVFNLITPFCMFVLLLFSLPLVFVFLSFGAAFYIFINKHRAKLMVRSLIIL